MPKAKTATKTKSTKTKTAKPEGGEPTTKKDNLTDAQRGAMEELQSIGAETPTRSSAAHGYVIQMNSIEPQRVPLGTIFYHPGRDPLMTTRKITQTRVGFDKEYAVEELAPFLLEDPNFDFPAIQMIYNPDTGLTYIADGFHRLTAYQHVGRETIPVRLALGTEEDAIKVATGANAEHGRRRTRQDIRKAVTMLLQNPEFAKRSDTYIANCAKVSQPFVGKMRKEIFGDDTPTERIGTDGKTHKVSTTPVGSKPSKAKEPDVIETRPENKYITEDANGDILPDHLQRVFTCGKDVAAKVSELKRSAKALTEIVSAYQSEDNEGTLYAPIVDGIETALKQINSALNRLNRESLPKYISPYTKGRENEMYPDSEEHLAPVEGYEYPDGTRVNIGWVSDTQYKESPEDLRNDPDLLHYDYDFGTEEVGDEEADDVGTVEEGEEIEVEADPDLMQDSPDEEEEPAINAFA